MSSSATNANNATAGATPKSSKAKKEKIVTLKLSSTLLAKFPSDVVALPSRKESNSSATPAVATPGNAAAEPTPQADGADSNAASTPAASGTNLLAPPANAGPGKRKGVPGPKPGMKRTASQLEANGAPKPRGKPGPKKKQKVGENGEILQQADKPAAPKLGPKASGGAINANLRALDRTGKPCRKWQKHPFAIKSFTGYHWGANSAFATVPRNHMADFPGDVKSDSSSSGEKPTQASSALASENGNSGESGTPNGLMPLASSPANGAAIKAAA